ncbi:MAG: hypothetical protein ACLRMZ_11465 [Blautia marasmi]
MRRRIFNGKKKKIRKGDFGYITSQKKKEPCTPYWPLSPRFQFFTGLIIKGNRNTVFTVVAVVACLPACKFAVGMIMMYIQKPMSEKDYQQIEKHKNGLTLGYELVISAYEKQTFVDSMAVCGNTVVGYTSREKSDIPFTEKHIQSILRQNGYYVKVKIFRKLPDYLDRLESMWEHHESLEKDIRFTPDEKYPDLTRNELILHTIYAISL